MSEEAGEKIHRRAASLAEVLQSEGQSSFSAQKKPRQEIPWQRIVFAAILITATLIPYFMPTKEKGPGFSFVPAGIQDFQNIIQALPRDAAVLVGVDYQPGYSGELNRLARPVLLELMRKQARLVMVSTIPTGPLQADQLVGLTSQAAEYPYQSSYEIMNLGYLPGGRTGLQKLAAGGDDVFSQELYSSAGDDATITQPVQSVSDFDLVWVISDSPGLARDWIEQVGPHLEGVPLVMSLSEQAGPLVHPYTSGQVQGMMVGISEGLALQDWLGSGEKHIPLLVSYQNAIWTAAGLIVLFIFLSLAASKRDQSGPATGHVR